MGKILVIHGPNLNLLGKREPSIYGSTSIETINKEMMQRAKPHQIDFTQSNAEHDIVEKIHKSQGTTDFIIINPAAFTHTSIALRDALLAVKTPFFEVHLSNIYSRETFRHHSYLSDIAVGVISGLGPLGYYAALDAVLEKLS